MKVFISHASADSDFAMKLARRLSDEGLKVFRPEADIEPGQNWHFQVGRQLEAADAVAVLISPDAVRSDSVKRDIDYALTSERPEDRFFVVLLKATPKMPWILRKLQAIKSTDPKKVAEEIVQRLHASRTR